MSGAKGLRMETKYERPSSNGYTIVPVLHYLKGKPWDDMAMNYVHSLRPSYIRTSTGKIDADSKPWRVTVFLKEDEKTIDYIEQEVEVGLKGCKNGMDLGIHKEPIMVQIDQAILDQMQETLTEIKEETQVRVIDSYTFDPNTLKGVVLCLDNHRAAGVDIHFRFQLNDKKYEFTEFVAKQIFVDDFGIHF